MNFKFYFIFFIVLIFNSCESKNSERVIVFNELNKFEWSYINDLNFWTPQKKDLLVLDSIIEIAITETKFNFIKTPINLNYKNYYKQYVPFITNTGERIILINAFCEIPLSPSENNLEELFQWKKYYFEVNDGGDCYWNIKVNIDSKETFDLVVNGD